MKKTTDYIMDAAGAVGDLFNGIRDIFDSDDPIIILPYRGFANDFRFYLKGRVLENENIFKGKTDNVVQNIFNTIKRFETDEVSAAKVQIRINGQIFETETDEEGYFEIDSLWDSPEQQSENSWLTAEVELMEKMQTEEPPVKAIADIYFPSKNADYGVITDVDDTILQTHVTSRMKWKMLYVTFLKDASRRKPMEGMAQLFRAFVKGGDGKRENPIFYVSHSPWNLYDLLEQFLDMNKFPKGPVLLRDFGVTPSGAYAEHKVKTISQILKLYPKLPFVLLGDAAEKDADFYLKLASEFPNQIKAIYIRKVKDNDNSRRIAKLVEDHSNINVIIVNSSAEMVAHAREHGILKKQES